MKSNVALSYIAMLSVVGFFLWVIRNFVRGLRQKGELPPVVPSALPLDDDADKQGVDWPAHIFMNNDDDIAIPGRIVSVSPGGAFLESSACLQNGQNISIYVDAGDDDQVRLSAYVVWARESRDGRNAAQLVFPAGASGADLYSLAN
jgi:hypothetical protein